MTTESSSRSRRISEEPASPAADSVAAVSTLAAAATAAAASGAPPAAPLGRRRFLRGASAALCAAAACGAGLLAAGCTPPVRSFRARRAPVVDVPMAPHPELERPGGTVKVLVEGFRAVFVRHEGEGRFSGISAVCTHQGCIVSRSRDGFRCPCHGSTYDREGQVTGGPAQRPLRRFQAAREGGVVKLHLGEA